MIGLEQVSEVSNPSPDLGLGIGRRWWMGWRAAVVGWMLVLGTVDGLQASSDERAEFFENRIRPLLVNRCLECHSSQTELSGGLGLDSAGAWQRGGDSGKAIIAGDVESSLLWRAASYADPLLQMPPEGKLSAGELLDLRRWIEEGAFDPRVENLGLPESAERVGLTVERAEEHWAYRPLMLGGSPEIDRIEANRPATPIDAFLEWSRQERSSPQARESVSRPALLRRLSLDLYGLPPEREDLEAFTHDERPDATARWVDRALASPRFAERMTTRWLDVARYAESLTLRGFVLPQAWRYRDYVVDAMARDLPYDQFVREQIAGDLVVEQDLERRQRGIEALGFLVLGNHNLEEQDKRQLEMDIVDEQLDVIGKALLGQTLSCARCHDHKFDPIPTRDYYALAGILAATQVVRHANVSEWIERPLPLDAERELAYTQMEQQLTQAQEALKEAQAQAGKSADVSGPLPLERVAGWVVDDAQARRVGAWTESRSVPSYVGSGYLHDGAQGRGEKTLTFEPVALPAGTYRVRFAYTHGDNRASATIVRVFSAEGETLVQVDQRRRPEIDGHWVELGVFRFEPAGQAFVMVSNENADGHVIADAVQFLSVETQGDETHSTESESRLAEREEQAERLRQQIATLQSQVQRLQAELRARPRAIGLIERGEAGDLAIHVRGSVHRLGEAVPRGFLQALPHVQAPPESSTHSGRLELATWLTHPEQALFWRVIVNRVWGWTIGEPLVRSVDNFGTTGDTPTHPELLDWLALRLQDDGGSLQSLVRRMVLTDVYARDAGRGVVEGESQDPENRTFWRGARRRLDAESLRDAMLVVSDELELRSSALPLPDSLTSDYGYEHRAPVRSVYIPVFRNSMPSLFEAFDRSVTGLVMGERDRSTVAGQVLTLLNDPWVRERAEVAAVRRFSGSDEGSESLEQLFLVALGRLPTDDEIQACGLLLAANDGFQSPGRDGDLIERRADLIQAIFASPEFRFLE